MTEVQYFCQTPYQISDPSKPINKVIEGIENSIVIRKDGIPVVFVHEGALFLCGKPDNVQILSEPMMDYSCHKLVSQKKREVDPQELRNYRSLNYLLARAQFLTYDGRSKEVGMFEHEGRTIFVDLESGVVEEREIIAEKPHIRYLKKVCSG